jgi:glutaredoxin
MTFKKIFFILIIAGFLALPVFGFVQAQEKITLTLYHGEECPHCIAERAFLNDLKKEMPELEVVEYEVWHNEANQKLLQEAFDKLGVENPGIPFTIVGENFLVGFDNSENYGQKIRQMVLGIGNQQTTKLPFLGEINIKEFSIPILAAVIGTLDGFNPCSMWALITMITLILAVGDRKKLWIVGWTFILVSGFSYFLFMAAWLNAFVFLGFISIIRIIIGLIAVASGVAALNDFIAKKYNVCLIGNLEQQKKISDKFNKILNKNWWAIIAGVAGIAFSVNLVELMCSIGFPVIFTQALALQNMAFLQKYLYIILYVFFYMLLNIIVLLTAGFSSKFLIVNEKYTKYSHLIAGLLMLALGLVFIFKPELLAIR